MYQLVRIINIWKAKAAKEASVAPKAYFSTQNPCTSDKRCKSARRKTRPTRIWRISKL
jgi:hypothetical protein